MARPKVVKTALRADAAYRALLALVRTSSLLRKAGDRFFADFGLTQVQFNVLMILKYDAPGGCTQRALGELLLVEAADVTGIVKRMLAQGLLTRERHPSDNRAWIVRLSPHGKEILARVEPPYYTTVDRVMSLHKPRDLALLERLLDETQAALARETGGKGTSA